jgi:DNA polymerase-3 subunit delta'
MLAATGGQPQDVLDWLNDGIDAKQWLALPRQLARGEVGTLAAWPLPRVVDMLQKLCHDAMCVAAGSSPRYFPAAALPEPSRLQALSAWARTLASSARQAEHPWNAGLMVESLTQQARTALETQA